MIPAPLAAAVAGLLVLAMPTASFAARRGKPPSGNAAGLALLARVHHAYLNVRAVAVFGRAGSLTFRFTLVLSSGVGTAEQFVASGPSGTTTLVAPPRSATFAREPGSSCWRKLAASDPQSFENVGLHFPDQSGMTVKAPRRTSTGWLLPVVIGGGPAGFAIDGRSRLIRSITIGSPGKTVLEHVQSLSSRPTLPTPEPRC